MQASLLRSTAATLALIGAGAAGLGALTAPAFAADAEGPAAAASTDTATDKARDAVAETTQKANDSAIIKTVDEAYSAMRAIRAARIAIFDGAPEAAGKLVGDAEKDLAAAQGKVASHAIKDKKPPTEGDAYLPFDAELGLAEGFKPSADKADSLAKANEHLAKGETRKAAEVLKLANIDITVSAALLPVNAALGHVKDAQTLIGEKKYYEANLALKAVEDSVIVDSYSSGELPAQG